MKTRLFYIILAATLITSYSCQKKEKDYMTSSIHKVNACDYGDSELFQYYYDQIYSLADSISNDGNLLSLIPDFLYNWGDEIGEDYNKYDEHAEYYHNLAYQVSQTNTYQTLDDIISHMIGATMDDLESDSEGHLAEMYSFLLSLEHVDSNILYEVLNSTDFYTYEIPLLYTICTLYNHSLEKSVMCYLILDDGTNKCPYAFLQHTCPSYNTPFTIWTADVPDIYTCLHDIHPLAPWVRENGYVRDSISFTNISGLRLFMEEENHDGVYEVTAVECTETWIGEINVVNEEYRQELNRIVNSQLSKTEKQALILVAKANMEVKKEAADSNYRLCLAICDDVQY